MALVYVHEESLGLLNCTKADLTGFYINLPIGAVVAGILVFIRIPKGAMKSDKQTLRRMLTETLDLVGFAIFAPASIQFFLALQYGGGQHAWDSATVIGLFCGSAAMFVIFLIWEYHKGGDAMIPLPILRRRIVWSSCLTLFFIVGILICAGYYLPIWFQAVKRSTPTMSGVDILPNVLAQIVMSMVAGITGECSFCLTWAMVSWHRNQADTILDSSDIGVLPPLHFGRHFHCCGWIWPAFDAHADLPIWTEDRIPDNRRSWMWSSGTYCE